MGCLPKLLSKYWQALSGNDKVIWFLEKRVTTVRDDTKL